jgi:hypothetical protein
MRWILCPWTMLQPRPLWMKRIWRSQMNRNVFHELEPEVRAAVGDHVFELITKQDKPGSTERAPGQTSVELVAAE